MNLIIRNCHYRIGWWWSGLTYTELFAEERHGFLACWPIIIAWYETPTNRSIPK